MAYRTQWKLDAEDLFTHKLSKLQMKEIDEYIEENEDMKWVFGEGLTEWGEDDRSFTDSDENMFALSKHFSNIIFTLKYDQIEDSDDSVYVEYWLNGEVQREKAKYSVDEFDINKLKHVL